MNATDLTSLPWFNKISHHAQVGGIETSVLDNGAGRGNRIAWINTGTGLRYKVVLDRAMDIAEAFYNGHSLAWISPVGVTAPQPAYNKGTEWLKTFGGGMMTTCGISHSGPSDSDETGERSLHGPISNIPAEVESVIQPDPARGKLHMSITGRVREAQIFGPSLEMTRTISGTLGKPVITVKDVITNTGNTAAPHMLLYHLNFGWPLVDKNTRLIWEGKWRASNELKENKIFRNGNDFRTCPGPLEEHNGGGEDVAFIDIEADEKGNCTCGLYNERMSMAVKISFDKSQLPWLINWQHWGKNDYVTALEPGTHPPIGQAAARKSKILTYLQPGESRSYDLAIEVLTEEKDITNFLLITKTAHKNPTN